MNKSFTGALTPVNEADLELINAYTLRELKAEEIYTFSLTLCDNEIDRDGERFTVNALNELAELFRGRPGISDHSMKSCDQTARIYYTAVEADGDKLTSQGEPYTRLTAKAYLPRTEKQQSLIEEIEAGIKKEISVGCSVKRRLCSVCGEPISTCSHIKGRSYGGKICHVLLDGGADAYEFSFVAVPAQRTAGITKAFDGCEHTESGWLVPEEKARLVDKRLEELSEKAALGECYLEELTAKVCKGLCALLPDLSGSDARELCSHSGPEALRILEKALRSRRRTGELTPQLAHTAGKSTSNSEYKI